MEFRYSLYLTIFLFSITNCQLEEIQQILNRKRYCGDNLSSILSAICKGRYNTLHKNYKRRNEQHYQSDDPNAHIAMYSPEINHEMTISREAANSLLSRGGRRKRGVYNECCEKSCSREELSTYCDSVNRKRRDLPIR